MEVYLGTEMKRVVVRDDMAFGEHTALHDAIFNLDTDATWMDRARALCQIVSEWEFDGDPTDVESWGALDIFEIIELENKLAVDLGDAIELRKRFPASEFDDMGKQLRHLGQRIHWRKRASVLIPFLERLDMLTDFKDADQWGALSIFQVLAIEQAITTMVMERTSRAKN